MSNLWAIRIHTEFLPQDGTFGGFREFIRGIPAEGYLFVREVSANRPHLQGFIRTDMKQNTLRERLKKAYPLAKGNRAISCAIVRDTTAYEDYLFKGTPDELPEIICSHAIDVSEASVFERHTRYWATHQKQSTAGSSLVQQVTEWAGMFEERPSREAIVERICDLKASKNQGLNVFYIRMVANTIEWNLGDNFRSQLISEICNKY